MPEGPFGWRRFFSIGPFTTESLSDYDLPYNWDDERLRDLEFLHGKTVLQLSSVTDVPPCYGRVLPDDYSGASGRAHGKEEEWYIGYGLVLAYITAKEGRNSKWGQFFEYLSAHEFSHLILEHCYESGSYDPVYDLYENNLFHYADLDHVEEVYEFEPEEYRGYDSIEDFIDHIQEYGPMDPVRPVEGFCNAVGGRYSGFDPQDHTLYKNKTLKYSKEATDPIMRGEKNPKPNPAGIALEVPGQLVDPAELRAV